MIKLIAIDIDGTLLNTKRELTDRVKTALKKATLKGVKVVICTGRPNVLPLLTELDLIGSDQYVISFNGALVTTTDNSETILSTDLPFEAVKKMIALADILDVPYHAIDREAIYTTNKNIGQYTVHEAQLVGMPIRYRTIEELEEKQFVAQKMMYVDAPEKLDAAIAKLPKWVTDSYFTVKSAPFYLEILNKKANKGSALKALCNHLGISLEDVMAIGDNYNDIDMLTVCGHAVAMGNAVQALKDIAKYITLDNDNDGVAHIVEKLVLNPND